MGELVGNSVCILPYGCMENVLDANLIKQHLVHKYHCKIVQNYGDADHIVFLGCIATQPMEDYARSVIDLIDRNKRFGARLYVMGCLSTLRSELAPDEEHGGLPIKEINEVIKHGETKMGLRTNSAYYPPDFTLLNQASTLQQSEFTLSDFDRLGQFINCFFSPLSAAGKKVVPRIKYTYAARALSDRYQKAFLRISMGCLMKCSYCSIRLSRGAVISKPVDMIVEEFRNHLDRGYKKFVLTGTNIGQYGIDIGRNLKDLLAELLSDSRDYRLLLRNLSPNWVIKNYDALGDHLSTGKIRYLQIPLQSGNNRILRLMNRGYKAKDLVRCMEDTRKRFPKVFLSTHIMVGFPSETDEEFNDSLELVKRGVFDRVICFKYQDCSVLTKAATFEPKIDPEVIKTRHRKIFFTDLQKHRWRKLKGIASGCY